MAGRCRMSYTPENVGTHENTSVEKRERLTKRSDLTPVRPQTKVTVNVGHVAARLRRRRFNSRTAPYRRV